MNIWRYNSFHIFVATLITNCVPMIAVAVDDKWSIFLLIVSCSFSCKRSPRTWDEYLPKKATLAL